MTRRFVSERIEPVAGTADVSGMRTGEPGLPRRFVWRGAEYTVVEMLRQWKETGPCTHGSGEQYVRKHWFDVRTAEGLEMRIYFERKPRSKRELRARWWLHSTEDRGKDNGDDATRAGDSRHPA